jgi:hypothetical protein
LSSGISSIILLAISQEFLFSHLVVNELYHHISSSIVLAISTSVLFGFGATGTGVFSTFISMVTVFFGTTGFFGATVGMIGVFVSITGNHFNHLLS